MLTMTLFITTLIFASLFSITLNSEEKLSLENYEYQQDISAFKILVDAYTEELRECSSELYEYWKYIGSYELDQRRKLYNTPAIDWEEIATSTATTTY